MTVRTDFTFNMEVSPRIVTIAAPSVEATVQDIHDTITNYEDSVEGGQFERLILSAGKEDLGGSVTVGITSTLQNAQIQFAGRTTATEFGAVSSNDTTGTLLNAVGGLFVTNGISRGDTVFNSTTGSMGTILSVTDETNLVSQQITGGARTTWLNTDNYSIYQNVQCNISGGNLVAIDDVGASISSVLQSPNTNVVRTASSSATLQNQEQLQITTFIGKEGIGATIDPVSGTDSSVYPYGTRKTPCKTETNLFDLEAEWNFRNVYVKNNLTISADHSSDANVWFGDNPQTVVITLDPACDVTGSKFQDCNITGKFDSANIVWECIVGSISNANGFIYKSTIIGPIVVSGTLSMEDCWTATPGTDNVIDFNSTANTVALTDWSGGTILVKNMVAGCVFGMGGTAGSLKLDSSCTGGSINHGGAIRIKEDLSTGTTINDASTATQAKIAILGAEAYP